MASHGVIVKVILTCNDVAYCFTAVCRILYHFFDREPWPSGNTLAW